MRRGVQKLPQIREKRSELTKAKIGFAHFGRKYSKELREHNRSFLLLPEVRLAKSLARKGSKSHFWKGGSSKMTKIIRESAEYRMWRESVFKRDNWTCQECKVRGGKLQADHINPFAFYPLSRFDVENGRTLCEGCHRKTETFGKRIDVIAQKLNNNIRLFGGTNNNKQKQHD